MTAKKGPSVLLIDDEVAIVEVCREVLEMHGCTVRACARAQEALTAIAQGEKFDVILSDYKMPLMNGLKLLKELRTQGCMTPFILLTGEMDSQEVDGPKPDLILFKPVRIDDMVQAITQAAAKG